MNLGKGDGNQANIWRTRANGRSHPPSTATTTHDATNGFKENTAHQKMATYTHSKKLSSGSLPDFPSPSPDVSRIPRPTSTTSATRSREPLRMTEALKLAADRHRSIQGSPSPAPRLSRKGSTSSEYRPLHHMFSQKPIDLGRLGSTSTRREGTFSSRDSFGSTSRKDEDYDSDLDRRLKQFEEDEKILKAMREEKNAQFVKRKTSGTGSTTPTSTRKASATSLGNGTIGNGSLGGSSRDEPRPTWGDRAKYDGNWLRKFQNQPDAAVAFHERLVGTNKESREQTDMAPVGRNSPSMPQRSATTGPLSHSKAFSWQVDDDFTAGDLQVSTSPPVSFGRANTKIDELRKLEIDVERKYPVQSNLFTQRTNTKLDEIARLEREAVRKYPVTDVEDSGPVLVAEMPTVNEPFFSRLPRSNGDTDYAKKAEEISQKAVATTQLDEIRQRRSVSPEVRRETNPEALLQNSPRANQESKDLPPQDNGLDSLEGQKIPNTPVTVYSGTARSKFGTTRQQSGVRADIAPGPFNKEPVHNEDAQDLLRRLARASSKSPSPSPSPMQNKVDSKPQEDQKVKPVPISDDKVASDDKDIKAKGANKTDFPSKPTVGFTGIPRSSSSNSASSKRSSMASHDPTSRLEAEANLFALENHSERGSIRAPSPLPDSESEAEDNKADETPRPDKFDPSSMPTPLVTGAYIDTPATMKVERPRTGEYDNVLQSKFLPHKRNLSDNRDPSTSSRMSKPDGQTGYVRRRPVRDMKRSRSAPRHRSPLKNSVKPPTVQEDLRQICQRNDIDDSTLDDLTDIVMSSSNPEELVNILKKEDPEDAIDELPLAEQLRILNGMSESLKTGLAGIRTAKQGIERLEDQVSHPEKTNALVKTPTSQHQHAHPVHDPSCPQCATLEQGGGYTYMHVPIPRLYQTRPRFRLTFTGFLVLLLSFWHMWWFVEDIFYDQWGKQEFCYRGSPCRWDVDDPEYGFVIPVKLDEWLTGGVIRPHAARWLEEAQDSWADFEDWWAGIDIRHVDHRVIRDSTKKAQYWRRIEKKGLYPKWNPASWMLPQIEAWEREMQAQEEAEARAAMGYNIHEDFGDESMDKDQPVSRDATDDPSDSWW